MDQDRFDELTRSFAGVTSRRQVLKMVALSIGMSLLGRLYIEPAQAIGALPCDPFKIVDCMNEANKLVLAQMQKCKKKPAPERVGCILNAEILRTALYRDCEKRKGCPPGYICSNNICCPSGQVACGTVCYDPADRCLTCQNNQILNVPCSICEICDHSSGVCRPKCPTGQICDQGTCRVCNKCEDSHVDSDGRLSCAPKACGTCMVCDPQTGCVPKTCPSSTSCNPNTGNCEPSNSCPEGKVYNPQTHQCEACGVGIPGSVICANGSCCPGLHVPTGLFINQLVSGMCCNNVCVDYFSDPSNCGGCNQPCSTTCCYGNCCKPGEKCCPPGSKHICLDAASDCNI